jgi:glutamate racemase
MPALGYTVLVDNRALGIFDSGVGGLTVVRAVQALLPAENIAYLGDTARVPYGSKSPETIRRFSDEDVRYLLTQNVKAIVVACNTATAHALPMLQDRYPLPIIGVIEAGVEAVLSDPQTQRVGIIATRGTIHSHAYQHALALRRTGMMIAEQATPLLVPLIEENWIDHSATRDILQTYLQPLLDKHIDTLLLACTHYPLLVPLLEEMIGERVRIVDSATTCAQHLQQELARRDMLADSTSAGTLSIALTDLSEQFELLAKRFLHKCPPLIKRVEI